MTMWFVIMWVGLVLTGLALVYVSTRVYQFGCIKCLTGDSKICKALVCGGVVLALFIAVMFWLNFMNAIVCIIYFALAWVVCDLVFAGLQKILGRPLKFYYSGIAAILLSIGALCAGWYYNHNVWQTNYELTTNKNVPPLRIAMFADSHLGTTFDSKKFAEYIEEIQAQEPDIVLVVGDFVDDGTKRDEMLKAAEILGKMHTKYGTYFVFGNHDSGYYSAEKRGFGVGDLIEALQNNGVFVLRDEAAWVNGLFYVIGRQDYSIEKEKDGTRKSMAELTQDLDRDQYIIVLDHQPADYQNEADADVDLVLSGHTHGGQLLPFNLIGKWIGANDNIYGHEKRKNTDFIVTSGLSDWAIKFKTGTKSEYVIIDVKPEQK